MAFREEFWTGHEFVCVWWGRGAGEWKISFPVKSAHPVRECYGEDDFLVSYYYPMFMWFPSKELVITGPQHTSQAIWPLGLLRIWRIIKF